MDEQRRTAGHQALRRGRYSEAGRLFLVTSVTHDRLSVFTEWATASFAAALLNSDATWRPHARPLCWVLMPDHFHVLLELQTDGDLSKAVNFAKGRISYQFGRQFQKPGRLWADAFHDYALRRDEDTLAVARYVILNPVCAGLVKRVGDYLFWNAVWL